MTRPVAVLRPEPGNAATAARAEALGLRVLRLPLFVVTPVAWAVPDASAYDALILTSANALRHGGAGLAALRALPVFAVGERTAESARDAGFDVMTTGTADLAALLTLAEAQGVANALHLGGRDRVAVQSPAIRSTIAIYASDAVAIAPDTLRLIDGSVALLHSARAARRLAALAGNRMSIRIAALSEAVNEAAGPGWAGHAVAARPDDDALLATARMLAD
ncbi:uroporphyrinogen-III synthase [Sphingomonas alpina]|uniref:Uroporphyrinogen-III synthase n=1 Tax=Sphingomonas alpina TaxID=653931 RepID=A0A7H0LHG0_9SPHN|nr:uroporphyrinogen-III synthase [Sphingomonas alpina]QNQ09113.1 uroporphyrinogen-III synthase [Sphingomonas alpina]